MMKIYEVKVVDTTEDPYEEEYSVGFFTTKEKADSLESKLNDKFDEEDDCDHFAKVVEHETDTVTIDNCCW